MMVDRQIPTARRALLALAAVGCLTALNACTSTATRHAEAAAATTSTVPPTTAPPVTTTTPPTTRAPEVTVGSSSTSAPERRDQPAPNDDQLMAEYEDCLADEGVELPSDSGGVESDGNIEDIDPEALNDAYLTCGRILDDADDLDDDDPFADLTPAEEAALEQYMTDLETCLAAQGFDVPLDDFFDPDADPDSVTVPDDVDWEEFIMAVAQCDEQVPTPPELEDLLDA